MKRRPCWCPKPFLWELNSFLMQTLSFVPTNLHRCWPRQWKHSMADITVVTIKCVQVGRLAFLDSQCTGGGCSVAVVSSVAVWSSHLSTNRMRFYFFQSKCVVIVSSLSVTSQLGEGCNTSFVRFVFLILWKTWVWNSFEAFSPMGFWRILQKCEVCSKRSLLNAYVHMLES